jgi:K+-sensing histidine kinase KdpD
LLLLLTSCKKQLFLSTHALQVAKLPKKKDNQARLAAILSQAKTGSGTQDAVALTVRWVHCGLATVCCSTVQEAYQQIAFVMFLTAALAGSCCTVLSATSAESCCTVLTASYGQMSTNTGARWTLHSTRYTVCGVVQWHAA